MWQEIKNVMTSNQEAIIMLPGSLAQQSLLLNAALNHETLSLIHI